MIQKKSWPWAVLFIVVVLALGALAGWAASGKASFWNQPPKYTAVYLTTGEVYFGEMTWFPKPRLRNVWYLRPGVDENNEQQLGLLPFKDVVWGPKDELYLSPAQIVWTARVSRDSELIQAFEANMIK